MKKILFVTGGGRSGKSRYAITYALKNGKTRAYIATAQACDDEMKERIRKHKEDRGDDFVTIEEPLDLGAALRNLPAGVDFVLIDCLTVWLGNWMHQDPKLTEAHPAVNDFMEAIQSLTVPLVIVSNEVGMGIIPENAMARQFRDVAGRVNQQVAQHATDVVLLVSGLPMTIKGEARE